MRPAFRSAVLAAATAYATARNPYLVRRFYGRFGFLPNIGFPTHFNEKLLWRKLFDHSAILVTLTDKLAVKDFAAERCPDLPIPRVLWSGTSPREIPEAALGGSAVVKVSNGWHANFFVADGKYDRRELEGTTAAWLRTVHGKQMAEWAYGAIRPRLFVEERIPHEHPSGATDIKVHICDGAATHAWVANVAARRGIILDGEGRPTTARPLEMRGEKHALPYHPTMTAPVAKAYAFARRLGAGIDYCRFDFLTAGDDVFFGEATVYPSAGHGNWTDPAIAARVTAAWDLRLSGFLKGNPRGPAGLYARTLRVALDAS